MMILYLWDNDIAYMRCPRRGINDFVGEMGLKKMPLVILDSGKDGVENNKHYV